MHEERQALCAGDPHEWSMASRKGTKWQIPGICQAPHSFGLRPLRLDHNSIRHRPGLHPGAAAPQIRSRLVLVSKAVSAADCASFRPTGTLDLVKCFRARAARPAQNSAPPRHGSARSLLTRLHLCAGLQAALLTSALAQSTNRLRPPQRRSYRTHNLLDRPSLRVQWPPAPHSQPQLAR